jgi:hypothetical protein
MLGAMLRSAWRRYPEGDAGMDVRILTSTSSTVAANGLAARMTLHLQDLRRWPVGENTPMQHHC